MKQKKSVVLACFSPPVMVATFLIEVLIAGFVLFKYKFDKISKTIVALLLCLAAFQLAEYFVCTNSSIAVLASRLGYVAITLLPPLGLYLMSLLTSKLSRQALVTMLVSASAFIGYFLLSATAFKGYECTGNYVIFQLGTFQAWVYGFYYYSLIIAAIWRGANFIKHRPKAKTAISAKWLLAGYAFFITPVAVLVVMQPDTRDAIPSILCGFAVTMAITLGAKVAPGSLKLRS